MAETLEQYRRAEHLCLRCGRQDDWTEEGHRLCWRCMVREDRSKWYSNDEIAAAIRTIKGALNADSGAQEGGGQSS